MRPAAVRAIDLNACARKVEVDHRISLSYYYRIAANLLKQATIYREERNLIDLYIILLRFSSLMCETIPSHRDYQSSLLKEKAVFKKKAWDIISELEALKPDVHRQVDELNRRHVFHSTQDMNPYNSTFIQKQMLNSVAIDQTSTRNTTELFLKSSNERDWIASSDNLQIERQFQKMSLSLPHPKEETLSRHSILGPNGLRGQWKGPITGPVP